MHCVCALANTGGGGEGTRVSVRSHARVPADLTVDEQLQLISNTDRLLTPHGAFPSVFSFLLRPGAIVYELTAACYFYTWVPASVLRRPPLNLRHVYLSWRLGDMLKASNASSSFELVHPESGKLHSAWTSPWCCCRSVGRFGDLDMRMPPTLLREALAVFEDGGSGGGGKRPRTRRYKGAED